MDAGRTRCSNDRSRIPRRETSLRNGHVPEAPAPPAETLVPEMNRILKPKAEESAPGKATPAAPPAPALTPAPTVTAPAPIIPIKKVVTVNQITAPLEEFLSSLSSDRQKEIKKYSNVPDGELVAPTNARATALINAFGKEHATVPAKTRNNILFKYSCLLRRCGIDEPGINEGLWSFSLAHCKPPHNQNNHDDVAELKSLSARAARYVKVGFPRAAAPEPGIKAPEPATLAKMAAREAAKTEDALKQAADAI